MSKITSYFRDVRGEFSQVTWPPRNEALRLTIVVVLFAIGFAIFLGAIDYLFGEAIRSLLLV